MSFHMNKPPGGSLGRQSWPTIFVRNMHAQGAVTVPRLILDWWRPIPGDRLDIKTARSKVWDIDYAYMRPAADDTKGVRGIRYKLSGGRNGTRAVSLPQHFLSDMRGDGEIGVRVGIIQLGWVAVIVSVKQLEESARRASEMTGDQEGAVSEATAARIGAIASDIARPDAARAHTVSLLLGQALDKEAFREALPEAARFIRRRAA